MTESQRSGSRQQGRSPGESSLAETVALLTEQPGVYIFRDDRGEPLYVGKARSLRQRVRSYFQSPHALTSRTLQMVGQAATIEHIVTDTEVEALILESNLIKRYRPRYNIRLRDDKQYPYIRVGVDEAWPRVTVARQVRKDGARYFGPYTTAGSMRETLKTIRRAFPYRSCSDTRLRRGGRACLYHDLGRCLAPCIEATDADRYGDMVAELCQFLEGRQTAIVERLRWRMEQAAAELRFEAAAELRDQLRALERVLEKQKIASSRLGDEDLVALARNGDRVWVQIFFVRDGKLVGREQFTLDGAAEMEDGQVVGAFLKQYYERATFIPPVVLVQAEPEDAGTISLWLAGRRGAAVELRRPQRGPKRQLLEMVQENARLARETDLVREERRRGPEAALTDLAQRLRLPGPPRRIECYDISNLQGHEATGSMAVFVDGQPERSAYRKFRIKTVTGSDDYAMLQEVLHRRFRRAAEDGDWTVLPDLVVIDGGKGQLGAALEVLKVLEMEVPICSLAKREEEVFMPGSGEPLDVPLESPAANLLRQIRDEAHRFAVGYHRHLRGRRSTSSVLDEVQGIGRRRRQALYREFGSLEAIRQASVDELARVPGMNRQVAQRMRDYFDTEDGS